MKYTIIGINKNCEEFKKQLATIEEAREYAKKAVEHGAFSIIIRDTETGCEEYAGMCEDCEAILVKNGCIVHHF